MPRNALLTTFLVVGTIFPSAAVNAAPPDHAQANRSEQGQGNSQHDSPSHQAGEPKSEAKHNASSRGQADQAEKSNSPPAKQGDHDGDADRDRNTRYTEDNDADGVPNNVPDQGDNRHPSGRDRSVEQGKSGNQGKSESDPDDNGRGPDRSNNGRDKPNGSGGIDRNDQDGNNGCGNDDDFEDDNEGWCGHKPKPQPTKPPVDQPKPQCPNGTDKPADGKCPKQGPQPPKQDQPKRGKITICHATGSATNPYVLITIDESAVEAHRNHQDGRDIIPAPASGCPTGQKPPDQKPGPGKDECPDLPGNQPSKDQCPPKKGGPPPVDLCPNVPGLQIEVPPGMVRDVAGNCIIPVSPPVSPPEQPKCPRKGGPVDKDRCPIVIVLPELPAPDVQIDVPLVVVKPALPAKERVTPVVTPQPRQVEQKIAMAGKLPVTGGIPSLVSNVGRALLLAAIVLSFFWALLWWTARNEERLKGR